MQKMSYLYPEMKKDLENMEVLAKKVAEESSMNLKQSAEKLLDDIKVLMHSCSNNRPNQSMAHSYILMLLEIYIKME